MRVKKIFLLFILFFMGLTWGAAKEFDKINFFTAEIPEFYVRQDLQFNLWQDSKDRAIGFSTMTGFDMNELSASIGASFNNSNCNFTTKVIYWPTFFERFNFGLGITYHLLEFSNIFYENDFIADINFKMKLASWLSFYLNCGYFYKLSILSNFGECLENNSLNVNSGILIYPNDRWTLAFEFTSSNYFNYPLFFTAMFNTWAEFVVIPERFSTGVGVNTRFYDFFVNSQDLSHLSLNIFMRYKI